MVDAAINTFWATQKYVAPSPTEELVTWRAIACRLQVYYWWSFISPLSRKNPLVGLHPCTSVSLTDTLPLRHQWLLDIHSLCRHWVLFVCNLRPPKLIYDVNVHNCLAAQHLATDPVCCITCSPHCALRYLLLLVVRLLQLQLLRFMFYRWKWAE